MLAYTKGHPRPGSNNPKKRKPYIFLDLKDTQAMLRAPTPNDEQKGCMKLREESQEGLRTVTRHALKKATSG